MGQNEMEYNNKSEKTCNLEAKTRYSVAYKLGTYSENKNIQVLNQSYSESQDSTEQIK